MYLYKQTTRLLNKNNKGSCACVQANYETTNKGLVLVTDTYVSRNLVSDEERYFGVQIAKILFLPEIFFALETDLVLQLLYFNLGWRRD